MLQIEVSLEIVRAVMLIYDDVNCATEDFFAIFNLQYQDKDELHGTIVESDPKNVSCH